MGRRPCCAKKGLNRGAWTAGEDKILSNYINVHGQGKWRDLPLRAGLKRCGKSCRLRWLNYLKPDIKRGNISEEEEELIIKLHKLLGNRWSLIAGRLPGRTDNEIKNYWNTNLSRRVQSHERTQNSTKKQSSLRKNSSMGDSTKDSQQIIRPKPVRCKRVVIPPQLDSNYQMVKKNEISNFDPESPSPTPLNDRDNSANFLMDLDFNDLFISDFINFKFHQESKENEDGALLLMSNSTSGEIMVDSWKRGETTLQPHEALELKKLATFLDSEEEWIQ